MLWLWGLPVGIFLGTVSAWINRKFASFITSKGDKPAGWVTLLVLAKYAVFLGVFALLCAWDRWILVSAALTETMVCGAWAVAGSLRLKKN